MTNFLFRSKTKFWYKKRPLLCLRKHFVGGVQFSVLTPTWI